MVEVKKSEKKITRKKGLWIGLIIAVLVAGGATMTLVFLFSDNTPVINTPWSAIGYAGQSTRVVVRCTDDKGIQQVNISYSTNKVFWTNVVMTGTGTTDWTGSGYIPAFNIETTIYYQIYAIDTKGQITINDNSGSYYEVYTGSRKAIIVNSANDFYGEEPEGDFNASPDSNFDAGTGNWALDAINMTITPNLGLGYIEFTKLPGLTGTANMTYDWIGNSYSLNQYAEYNLSVDLDLLIPEALNSTRIGLKWSNSTGLARMDWSDYSPNGVGLTTVSFTGNCNNETNFEITGLELIVSVNVTALVPDVTFILLDNVKINKWIAVNNTDPTNQGSTPTAPYLNCDGFPAQALQIYWILKDQGYSDENIFLMLYHTGDTQIDIYALGHYMDRGTSNDLTGAVVDVENNEVNASRFKREMNVSISGSFASNIQPNDQLTVVLINHGSNALLGDGNATFHFEPDNSFITEHEFYELVKEINCSRMMINIDCCFSGNFIQSHPGVFYSLLNTVWISASSNCAAWYWINNQNGDMWAGSWFFNQFWEGLSFHYFDIMNAFIFAKNFVPFGRILQLGVSQKPLISDPNNIASSWSFSSNPKL